MATKVVGLPLFYAFFSGKWRPKLLVMQPERGRPLTFDLRCPDAPFLAASALEQLPLNLFNPEPTLIQETDPGVAETSGGNWATPLQQKQIPYQNGC